MWTIENLNQLKTYFVEQLDLGEGTFFEKLETQLEHATDSAKMLTAEMLWVLLLCPSNIGAEKKREGVELIWSWGSSTPISQPAWLDEKYLAGVGSGGTGYNTQRWRELVFFIHLMIAFKSLTGEKRALVLGDPWDFANWLQTVDDCDSRQFRHMLVFMLYPDTFDRVFGGTDRHAIASAFTGKPKGSFSKLHAVEVDRVLAKVRASKEEELGTTDLDFYVSPLRDQWHGRTARTWLLSWNPSKWTWGTLDKDRDETHAGRTVTLEWSCKNSNVAIGDKAYLVRSGVPPKGIVAVGSVVTAPYVSPHWDPEKASEGLTRQSVDVSFARIQDPTRGDPIVTPEQLARIVVDSQDWSPQASGIEIKARSAAALDRLWRDALSTPPGTKEPPSDEYQTGNARNLLYYGPPGTGKTWRMLREATKYGDRHEVVTFHQAYSYEDFIEGIRPVLEDGSSALDYRVVPGVFKRICRRARSDPHNQYALFIDEINRGNIAKIFGELITLVEIDKRAVYWDDGSLKSGMQVTLPYSGERFGVPANLDIIGAMNTADRSIALLDVALRRRFEFVELMPDARLIPGDDGEGTIHDESGVEVDLRALLDAINLRVQFLLNRDMTIGHSYFIQIRTIDDLREVFTRKVIPLLQEYFYDDWRRIQLVLRDIGPNDDPVEPQIVAHNQVNPKTVLGFDTDDFDSFTRYQVLRKQDLVGDSFRKIYEEAD